MQSKFASFMEAITGTLIGLVIAFLVTRWFLAIIHVEITTKQNIIFTLFMTVVSVVRSYFVRRMFNSEFWKSWKDEPFDDCDNDTNEVENGRTDIRIEVNGHEFTPKNFELVQKALREAINDDTESRERRREVVYMRQAWEEPTC